MVNAICIKGTRRNFRGTHCFNTRLATATYNCFWLRHVRCGSRDTKRKLCYNKKDARFRVILSSFILWGMFASNGIISSFTKIIRKRVSISIGVSASLIADVKCNATNHFPVANCCRNCRGCERKTSFYCCELLEMELFGRYHALFASPHKFYEFSMCPVIYQFNPFTVRYFSFLTI